MRVYVSGPLQGSADLETARSLYEQVAAAVTGAGHEAYVPHLHTDPTLAAHLSAAEVFERDLDALLGADVIVAHVGAPSTGVGAELGIARAEHIPIVGIRRDEERASRFAEGLIEASGGAVYPFGSTDTLAAHLSAELERLNQSDQRAHRCTGQPTATPTE